MGQREGNEVGLKDMWGRGSYPDDYAGPRDSYREMKENVKTKINFGS
jgi:hypothetical protein